MGNSTNTGSNTTYKATLQIYMNNTCKDCSHPLDVCRCTERTLDPNPDREKIIESIEARITTEFMKHHRSLPNDWARIAAGKIYSTHFKS